MIQCSLNLHDGKKHICLFILLYLFTSTSCSTTPVTTVDVDDHDIARAVWNALQDEHGASFRMINVKASDGDIELTGSVDSPVVKKRAEEIAEATPGVGSVDNRLSVLSTDDEDDQKI